MPTLVPAYGRKYLNKQEVLDAYRQGKDFEGDIMMQFRLCSCEDFPNERVELRYGRKNEKCVLTTVQGDPK